MTLILLGQESTDQYNRKTYYSKRWNEFLTESQFCSEEYFCNTCFRETSELVKGADNGRFDSLVQCERHLPQAVELLEQLRNALRI